MNSKNTLWGEPVDNSTVHADNQLAIHGAYPYDPGTGVP